MENICKKKQLWGHKELGLGHQKKFDWKGLVLLIFLEKTKRLNKHDICSVQMPKMIQADTFNNENCLLIKKMKNHEAF